MDAARCLNGIISYISRVTSTGTQFRAAVYEDILKKNEQLFSLLAVTVALCPKAQKQLDEAVLGQLMAKHREALNALGKAEGADTLRERFLYACPKFINPNMPDYHNAQGLAKHNEAVASKQLAAFAAEVTKRKKIPTLRQYLSLYAVSPPPAPRRVTVAAAAAAGVALVNPPPDSGQPPASCWASTHRGWRVSDRA